jgi:hypothetical protein
MPIHPNPIQPPFYSHHQRVHLFDKLGGRKMRRRFKAQSINEKEGKMRKGGMEGGIGSRREEGKREEKGL